MGREAIWLVGGGAMQFEAVSIAHDLGYELIVSDGDETCELSTTADLFVNASTFDAEKHLEVAEELRHRYSLVGVLTYAADCHYTVALLAEHLGLPGIAPGFSLLCWRKDVTRSALREAGALQPKSQKFTEYNDGFEYATQLRTPFVVKPNDSSGSRGFCSFRDVVDFSPDAFHSAQSFSTSRSVVIEERLEPSPDRVAEVSLETVWDGTQLIYLNSVDRWFGRDRSHSPVLEGLYASDVASAVELGHVSPSRLHSHEISDLLKQLNDFLCKILRKFSVANFILKFDLMHTRNGWVVLEMTPRLSGGWDSSLTSRLRGGRLIELAFNLAVSGKYETDYARFHRYHPSVTSCVFSFPDSSLKDCIGRRFASGTGRTEADAILDAAANLNSSQSFR